MPKSKRDEEGVRKWFAEETIKYAGLLKQSHVVGNAVGNRHADPLRVIASWLYTRICVTGMTLSQILEPVSTGYGSAAYLDHASIAILGRALIENAAVLLYVCDHAIGTDEWECRRSLIDLHDFVNRSRYITRSILPPRMTFQDDLKEFRQRLETNAFFKTIHPKRQRTLLEGADMFVEGRHEAMLMLGWGEDATRGIYKIPFKSGPHIGNGVPSHSYQRALQERQCGCTGRRSFLSSVCEARAGRFLPPHDCPIP